MISLVDLSTELVVVVVVVEVPNHQCQSHQVREEYQNKNKRNKRKGEYLQKISILVVETSCSCELIRECSRFEMQLKELVSLRS